jgi:hypothetical protein
MDDKTRHKRAMEDISHFFLSGKQPQNSPGELGKQEARENSTAAVPPPEGGNIKLEDIPEEKAPAMRVARPAATAIENKETLVTAVKNYLCAAHGEALAIVKSMESSRFGIAELTLFDKKNFCVLCGKIQDGAWFSDFLAASMGYYGWLRDCLQAGSLFFNKSPRLVLYMFCDCCPSMAPFIVEELNAAMSIRLVRYHVLQVPGDPAPIAFFQPIVPTDGNRGQESRTLDLSDDDWRRFNRLKEHASEE